MGVDMGVETDGVAVTEVDTGAGVDGRVGTEADAGAGTMGDTDDVGFRVGTEDGVLAVRSVGDIEEGNWGGTEDVDDVENEIGVGTGGTDIGGVVDFVD